MGKHVGEGTVLGEAALVCEQRYPVPGEQLALGGIGVVIPGGAAPLDSVPDLRKLGMAGLIRFYVHVASVPSRPVPRSARTMRPRPGAPGWSREPDEAERQERLSNSTEQLGNCAEQLGERPEQHQQLSGNPDGAAGSAPHLAERVCQARVAATLASVRNPRGFRIVSPAPCRDQ